MDIINVSLDGIKPYPKNPRINNSSVSYVANSISKFGFRQPIVVDKNNVIICGHTRYEAAKKLKLKTVPVHIAENLTEEQTKAYRLADNKTSETSTWDLDILDSELDEITEFDMADFGFTQDDLDDIECKSKDIKLDSVYQVVIDCTCEEEQQKIYDRLNEEGIKCRVLTL